MIRIFFSRKQGQFIRLLFIFPIFLTVIKAAQTYPFRDTNQPLGTGVDDLLSRLTDDEKIALLHQWQPAIPCLGIVSFRTGTEALHGIARLGTATVFPQAIGSGTTRDNTDNAAVNMAGAAAVAIVFVGNQPPCNGGWGSGCTLPSEGKEDVNRRSIEPETADLTLIRQVYNANPRTIVVLLAGFPYAINWVNSHIPAILTLAHGGQELGKRTYMYFEGTPLYPFGYGLSYTTFTCSDLRLSTTPVNTADQVTVSVNVKNTGAMTGDEVVQLYVRDVQASVKQLLKELPGFERVNIPPGQILCVTFTLPVAELAFWDTTRNAFYVEAGNSTLMGGSSSADIHLMTAAAVRDNNVCKTTGFTGGRLFHTFLFFTLCSRRCFGRRLPFLPGNEIKICHKYSRLLFINSQKWVIIMR